MIGTQIGSYKIVEKIGEGGMGVVYKGVDVTLDRAVAVKVLSSELIGNPQLVERFRAEAKAQANLNHTNIATLYSFIQQGDTCVIVMELLEGETVDQMIRRRGLIPAEEAVPIFRQALLGIGFAHRMGIVHRDIKPSNIMVTKSGIVKVMDFGIAKVLGGQRLTRTGTRMGTVAYMSPEQIRNLPVDIRSDIYSLGATLYEMFTAHLPFESESDFQVMSDHVNTPPTPPTRYYPYIAPGFEQCVLKALAKNPDDRFQTVEEFGAGLEHPLGLPGYVPAAVAAVGWVQPGAPAPPGAWTPPPGTPPGQQGNWTPTGAAPGAPWTPPGTPPPGGGWTTPPPGTPAGGTYAGGQRTPPPSMSGATWIGDGPAGAVPVYGPGASSATQVTIPPGGGPPVTPAPAAATGAPSKNTVYLILAAIGVLILILAAFGISHWINSNSSGGGGGSSSYTAGGGSGGGGGSVGGGSSTGGSSSASSQTPVQPTTGSGTGGLTGGSGSTGSTGASGLLAPPASSTTPAAPARNTGGGSSSAPPPRKVTPAAPATTPSSPSASNPPTQPAAPAPAPAPSAAAPAQPAAVAPAAPAGAKRYFVEHRHVTINFSNKDVAQKSYCEGWLTVDPDGTASYYCTQTFDGRCDRVSFGKGSIKSVKINGIQLHISSSYGNYDFYGTGANAGPDMQAAFETLSQFAKK